MDLKHFKVSGGLVFFTHPLMHKNWKIKKSFIELKVNSRGLFYKHLRHSVSRPFLPNLQNKKILWLEGVLSTRPTPLCFNEIALFVAKPPKTPIYNHPNL